MEVARVASLLLATFMIGIIAGVMFLYANTIMPGLAKTGDRTFVRAFQEIDTAIINPLFMVFFLGGLVVTGIAAVLHIGEPPLPWITAAFVLYLVVVVSTVSVNVPLNNEIKAAGPPSSSEEASRVRADFNEPRWIRWNLVRTVLTAAAFLCLAWALVLLEGTTG